MLPSIVEIVAIVEIFCEETSCERDWSINSLLLCIDCCCDMISLMTWRTFAAMTGSFPTVRVVQVTVDVLVCPYTRGTKIRSAVHHTGTKQSEVSVKSVEFFS